MSSLGSGMQALSIPNIKAFYPTLADITQRLHTRWQRAAERGEIIEMTDDLKRYTVDVTSALAFGEDPRTMERDHGVIQEHLERILPGVMRRTNALFPYWRYVKLPSDRRLERSLARPTCWCWTSRPMISTLRPSICSRTRWPTTTER